LEAGEEEQAARFLLTRVVAARPPPHSAGSLLPAIVRRHRPRTLPVCYYRRRVNEVEALPAYPTHTHCAVPVVVYIIKKACISDTAWKHVVLAPYHYQASSCSVVVLYACSQ